VISVVLSGRSWGWSMTGIHVQALNGFLAKADGKDKLTALVQVRHILKMSCGF
jgi:hypothetical protein